MTRDEAMRIMRDCKTGASPEENWLNAFVALGILKLDEPKSAIDKLADGMSRAGFNPFTRSELQAILDSKGIKAVEK